MIWDPAKDELSVSVMTMDKEAVYDPHIYLFIDSCQSLKCH
jgi:hypothetical protein